MDIDGIIQLAKDKKVDAIHPGYGFLSENANLARACEKADITFVGPRPEILSMLGDKTSAREIAAKRRFPYFQDVITLLKAWMKPSLFAVTWDTLQSSKLPTEEVVAVCVWFAVS